MAATKKINWILILQAWAMLWVVIGHSPLRMPITDADPGYVAVLYKIAYSFHMALFIFVSGYLFYLTRIERPWPYGKMMFDKLKRFGIPFIIFTFVAMLVKTVFSDDMSRPGEISLGYFVNAILYPNDGPMREFWFIAVILWMFLARPLWAWLLKTWQGTVAGIAVTLVLAVWSPMFENDLLCFPRALHYAFCFFVGMAVYRWRVIEYIQRGWIWLLVGSLAIYALLFVATFPWTGILLTTTAIVFSIILALVLDRIFPRIFFTFSDYTYQIYLMGIFFQVGCKILNNRLFLPYGGGYMLCVVTGLYGPVLVCKLIEKINWQPLCLLVGLKRK